MFPAFVKLPLALALVGGVLMAVFGVVSAEADSYCDALSAQLASVSTSRTPNPNRTNAIVQQLNRAQWQARQFNCGFRFLGPAPNPWCGRINAQIGQLRAQLRGSLGGNGGNVDWGARMERQRILRAMSSYRCQMPRTGNGSGIGIGFAGGGYRTLCVRTCDGYFFPISFSTSRSRFKIDEAVCKGMYPDGAAELFVHSNSSDSTRAVSLKGEPYADQPFALAFTKEFTPVCKGLLTRGLTTLATRFEAARAEKLVADLKAGKTSRRDRAGRLVLSAPVPALRPARGEDPETVANRAGNFMIEPVGAQPIPVANLDEEKPVRVVGGFFYTLPTEEETERMSKWRTIKPIVPDKPPVTADMIPIEALRGSLSIDGESKVGLP